ncbi:domon domain of stromal cell-derived receptor 2 [Plakobranchus ocellatus]|uniref:Domon domain of stromal cell-derived receptor 2 n=1 Tax=Plakobranchus ocellatus TaxID=259542 RepID=A0AAV3XUW8_9GAST|nr:domon domain of stromal cell-derived receptor 2 [Plakobranchus ocellatus]
MEDDDSWKQNIGFFQTPSTSDARLQCLDGKKGNGVTHTNNNVKKSITVSWKAPSEPVGNIVFHFTVVRGGAPNVRVFPSDYFMDLQSEPLRPASGFVGHVLPFQQETRDDTAMEIVVEDEGKVVYKLPSLRKLLRRRQ